MTAGVTAPPLTKILETGESAAKKAGAVLSEGYQGPKSIRFKGDIDLVTEFDLASERIIVDEIKTAFPGHTIIAEEGGETNSGSPNRWYIDPLDGTTNFAHGFLFFCVSIAYEALEEDGPEIQAGVIFDPLRDEMFTAVKGGGAMLNGRPLTVSGQTDLGRALVATGFPYDIRTNSEPVLARFRRILTAVQGVRRPGAAALDLAWLAAGRVDGFWEERLGPWDTAAGALIVQEAGGRVTGFSGQAFRPQLKEILATNGHLHYNMQNLLNQDV
ncbi:MAG: inositol monophosphatase family protein [Thermodesulfobacteriota bacterium]|nr:inositol monophosphatase family protein [Thermodesulfobacteriota bacterium]